MNLLVQAIGLDIANQILSEANVDDSGITFEPVSPNGTLREWKPDPYSMGFVKPGWKTVDPEVAQEFVRTQKIAELRRDLKAYFGNHTRSVNSSDRLTLKRKSNAQQRKNMRQ